MNAPQGPLARRIAARKEQERKPQTPAWRRWIEEHQSAKDTTGAVAA